MDTTPYLISSLMIVTLFDYASILQFEEFLWEIFYDFGALEMIPCVYNEKRQAREESGSQIASGVLQHLQSEVTEIIANLFPSNLLNKKNRRRRRYTTV